MNRKNMDNVLEELQEVGLEIAQDELPKTRLEKFLVICHAGHVRPIHMKDVRRGRYCGDCRYDKIRRHHWEIFDTLQTFDIRLNSQYTASRHKAELACINCGYQWKARVDSAISGDRGCPSCAQRGFNPSSVGYIYYLRVTTDDGNHLYKIGITNKERLSDRFCKSDLDRITKIKMLEFDRGHKAYELEQYYLNIFKDYKYNGDKILKSGGNTELFIADVLMLDKN